MIFVKSKNEGAPMTAGDTEKVKGKKAKCSAVNLLKEALGKKKIREEN